MADDATDRLASYCEDARHVRVSRAMMDAEAFACWAVPVALRAIAQSDDVRACALEEAIEAAHQGPLGAARETEMIAHDAFAASPLRNTLVQAREEAKCARLAATGTRTFVERAGEMEMPRVERARARLPSLEVAAVEAEERAAELCAACVEFGEWTAARKCREATERRFGLEAVRLAVRVSNKTAAAERATAGRKLEDIAEEVIREELQTDDEVHLLRNVQLAPGKAGVSGELDVIAVTVHADGEARVLAVCEAKENPNDIGEARDKIAELLDWASGSPQCDAREWANKVHPKGHFASVFVPRRNDTPATRLTTRSFAREGATTGQGGGEAAERLLWFVTRGKVLSGLTSQQRHVIINRTARALGVKLVNCTKLGGPACDDVDVEITALLDELKSTASKPSKEQLATCHACAKVLWESPLLDGVVPDGSASQTIDVASEYLAGGRARRFIVVM